MIFVSHVEGQTLEVLTYLVLFAGNKYKKYFSIFIWCLYIFIEKKNYNYVSVRTCDGHKTSLLGYSVDRIKKYPSL